MAAAKRQKLRTYEWCRLRNEFVDMPIWRAVARKTGVHLTSVLAVVIRLEALANRSDPRGSVADMSIAEFAASLDLSPAVVARVRSALEEPDIAWIEQDHVVDFYRRNPDHEDTTAAERQRRRRARLKQEREQALTRPPPSTYPPSRDVTRDSVTVAPRSDQIIKQDAASFAARKSVPENAPVAVLGSSLTPIDPSVFADQARALQWLKGDAEALVTGRLGCLRSKACQQIERWGNTLCGDVPALARAIHASLSTAARGEAFRQLVTNQVARQAAEIIAPALPLPPVAIKGGDHGR
jgi:hypothetical protein